MTGISMGDAHAIAEKFPWDRYHTVIDIGIRGKVAYPSSSSYVVPT